MRIVPLSSEQAILYKGLGILLIVLHNFLHSIPPIIGENEFAFRWHVVERFLSTMATSPPDWPRAVFTYLGHYGVQIFVFSSAYGLWRRYGPDLPRYETFLTRRFSKVYVPFLLAMLAYSVLWLPRGVVLGDPEPLAWKSLFYKTILASNVVPGEGLRPVGPWWFAPFILQFYLLYPVLVRVFVRFGPRALALIVVAALAAEWSFNPYARAAGLNLNYTLIGNLPVLCLGLYAATRQEIRIGWAATAAVAAVFVVSNLDATLWLIADAAAAVLLFVLPYPFLTHASMRGGLVYRVLLFFGLISLPLFLVNGFLRTPFTKIAMAADIWWVTLMCAVLSLLFSSAAAMLLARAEQWLRARLPRKYRSVGTPADAPTAA